MEHRTQIYLQDKHYRFLRERAEREGISLAQAIRALIEKEMPSDDVWQSDPIWGLGETGFRSGMRKGSKSRHDFLRESLKKQHRRRK